MGLAAAGKNGRTKGSLTQAGISGVNLITDRLAPSHPGIDAAEMYVLQGELFETKGTTILNGHVYLLIWV